MRHLFIWLAGLMLWAGCAVAAPLPALDMCAVDSSGYSDNLSDNGFLAELPAGIAAGTFTCDHQTMERLGTFGGRTYGLWQAWFSGRTDDLDRQGTVAQIGEVDADGKFRIVYRISEIDVMDAVRAKLVEMDSALVLLARTPVDHIWIRGPEGFVETNQTDLYEVPAATLEASLTKSEVPPEVEVDGATRTYRATFNFDEVSIDVPIAMASEIFPRTTVDPDYDRPLLKRFPLHLKGNRLVAEAGETVAPDSDTASGIGETPASVVVPKDIAACSASAFVSDGDPAGVAVRAAPAPNGQPIANLPGAKPTDPDSFGAELSIVGEKNGWFLIENASHPAELYGADSDAQAPLGTGSEAERVAYRGRGWVEGSRLSLFIQAGTSLRAEADPASKSVFDLNISEDGESFVTVTGLRACKGEAVDLDVTRSDGIHGSGWIGGNDDSTILCAVQGEECS